MTITVGTFHYTAKDGSEQSEPLTLDVGDTSQPTGEDLAESEYNDRLTDEWMRLQETGCTSIVYTEVHPLPDVY